MRVTTDIDVRAGLDALLQDTARALDNGSEYLLSEANLSVPHEDGTLERSGQASNDGKSRAAVSYDTPYAVAQHERMDYHHDGKGESKWLENAMARSAKTVGQIIATALRKGSGA